MWWTAGSAKRPLPLSSTVFAIHPLFWSTGCQQASAESGVPSESLSAVDTDTRFKHVRSPPAVSDTVSLDGWTGHLRRTVRNPLRSGRFLCCCMAACQVNVTVGNSGHTMVGRLAPPSFGFITRLFGPRFRPEWSERLSLTGRRVYSP